MKIAVCIKQVPLSTRIEVDSSTGTLVRNSAETQINPYDEYAIEEALRIRDKLTGSVIVYTMGPPQAESILKDAIAMGADEACLLTDKHFAGADTLATSYTISKALKKDGIPDLIICGKQAIDGDTAQVGPSISQLLNCSLSTNVQKISEINSTDITVEQMMDNGYQLVKLKLPAVITVVKGINIPRIATLSNRLKTVKKDISKYSSTDINAKTEKCGLKGSPTRVYKSFSPKQHIKGEIHTGSNIDLTKKLMSALKPFIKENC